MAGDANQGRGRGNAREGQPVMSTAIRSRVQGAGTEGAATGNRERTGGGGVGVAGVGEPRRIYFFRGPRRRWAMDEEVDREHR
jgi:hypothetical protein